MKNMGDFEELFRSSFSDQSEYESVKIGAEFSAKLLNARLSRNMTQKELAERSGLKQSAIARIENNGTLPRIDTVIKIAEALNTSLDLIPIEIKDEKVEGVELNNKIDTLTSFVKQLQKELLELKETVKKQKPPMIINVYSNRQSDNMNKNEYGISEYSPIKKANTLSSYNLS